MGVVAGAISGALVTSLTQTESEPDVVYKEVPVETVRVERYSSPGPIESEEPSKMATVVDVDSEVKIDTSTSIDSDSLLALMADADTIIDDELIIVKKDALLRTLVLELPQHSDTSSYVDTLAEHLHIEETKIESYVLELWESPLGYFGYRISGNRLEVYGLDTVTDFSLSKEDEKLILRAGTNVYHLKNTSTFTPFN